MIFTLNFHKFLRTMYKYVLNSVVKISLMFAKYFEDYNTTTTLLRGPFLWTRCMLKRNYIIIEEFIVCLLLAYYIEDIGT